MSVVLASCFDEDRRVMCSCGRFKEQEIFQDLLHAC
jgi:hypothetical protein